MNLIKLNYLCTVKLSLVLIVIMLLPYLLNATIYYVKTNGNDSLSGTSWQNAWRTIQKAANTMIAGDITYISNGTYYESVVVANSGAAGNPITFQAYNSGTVTIDANYSSTYVFSIDNKTYISIIGVNILHGTQYGIYINGKSDNFYISDCKFVHDGSVGGIYTRGPASGSDWWVRDGVITNCVFTNNTAGIEFGVYTEKILVVNNSFIGNTIGIRFGWEWGVWDTVRKITVKGNYISHNTFRGVTTDTAGPNIKFYNNTINSNADEGIYFRDASYTTYSNNIIIGNGKEGIEIDNWDEDTSYLYRNTIKRNNYGICILKYDNCTLKYNRICSNGFCGIYLSNSDKNTIISNHIFHHSMGIEITSSDSNTMVSNVIRHNNTGIRILAETSTNNKIIRNTIYSNSATGIYLYLDTGKPVTATNYILANYIFGPNQNYGINISSADNTIIQSNFIHHNDSYGIRLINDATGNRIIKNTIFSNTWNGVIIWTPDGDNNFILTNNIYGLNQYSGIFISQGDENTVMSNKIHHNQHYGIQISSSANSNNVIKNIIYSNADCGIFMTDSDHNNIFTNIIYGANQNRGINLTGSSGSHSVKVVGNFIYNNEETGIYFDWSDNSIIQHNRIYSNPIGIYYEDSTSEISLNTITNNNYGVVYASGSLTGFHKNNLSPNNCAFSNASGLSVKVTNNWWGSTIASVIKSKTIGITSYDEFTPYRLFGEFDITPGADTETPDIITGVHSYITNCKVKIVWNMSDAPDFARYSVYRSHISGTTNLTRSDVITNIYNRNITNYIDTPPNSGAILYYSVTALDNFIYTNESWYSTQTVVTLKTAITIVKSVSNVILKNNSVPAIPGATITYKITYSNNGCFSANNVIIYDKVSKNEVYFTQGGGTATGWIFECSTDESPEQSYSSADYVSILPSDKSKIRWIRWKKPIVTPDEDGLFLLYKLIIK